MTASGAWTGQEGGWGVVGGRTGGMEWVKIATPTDANLVKPPARDGNVSVAAFATLGQEKPVTRPKQQQQQQQQHKTNKQNNKNKTTNKQSK